MGMVFKFLSQTLILAVALSIPACSTVPDRNPIPEDLKGSAQIAGIEQARFFADAPPPGWAERITQPREVLKANFPALFGRKHAYLAVSGGGPDGAFGAGLLKGWTEYGDRPEFSLVTGISTGALIAPLAFLGQEYDSALEEIFTKYKTDDLFELRGYASIVFGDSAAKVEKFAGLIAKYIDDDAVARIAAAHRSGRRLWIGTTDLDASRPVIWNIGAIAASGQPDSKQLIHKILRASASIPGVFPPVYIDVEAGGKRYDEIHVDGGTTSQVFLYPTSVDWKVVLQRLEVPETPQAYIIRNSPLRAPPDVVDPAGILEIVGKSMASLIRTQGIGDLYTIYYIIQRDGLDYNLADIPPTFELEPEEPFDQVYMRALFDIGYKMARDGYPWEHAPPGVQAPGAGS
jgi:predicted acylesterase/phospholipase RssA